MNLKGYDGTQYKVAVIGGISAPYTVIERGTNFAEGMSDPDFSDPSGDTKYNIILQDNLRAVQLACDVRNDHRANQSGGPCRFANTQHVMIDSNYAYFVFVPSTSDPATYNHIYKFYYICYFRDLNQYGGVLCKSAMETGLYLDIAEGPTLMNSTSWNAFSQGITDNDPYIDHGDDSTTGGGTGTFDMGNDPITTPTVPSVSALTGQLLSMYAPTASELEQLSNFLWSNNFIDNIPKLFGNPFESLIALYLIGIQPPAEGTKEYVQLGYVSSGVQMYPVNTQFTTFDCGNLKIPLFWANALDYSPYTKLNIYLPYIGYRALDPDIIIDATVNLKYYIDLLTGSCTAILKVTKGNLSNIMYSFTGNICTQIPLTGSDSTAMTRTLVTAGVTVGALPLMPSVSAMTAATTATAMQVMGSKATVEQGGTAGSSYGLLSCKTPHIIINRPVQSKPENYQNYKGFPCNITAQLSSLSGYTEILEIHLENINATKSELDELENLLKSGVIL